MLVWMTSSIEHTRDEMRELETLLSRIAQGDKEALGMLYERTHGAIYGFALSLVRRPSDAEDILQETLIRYLENRPVFENEKHEKAWLFRVAANLSKNKIAYNKIRQADQLEDQLIAQEREDLTFVWDAVKRLPESYREAIHLYYYEGFPTAQIAEILERV